MKTLAPEVIDLQAGFIDATRSHAAHLWIQKIIESVYDGWGADWPGKTEGETLGESAAHVAGDYLKMARESALGSYAFYVTADMLSLVEAAGDQLPSTDTLDPDEMPAPTGFCIFENSYLNPAMPAGSSGIVGVMWTPHTDRHGIHGVLLTTFLSFDDMWNEDRMSAERFGEEFPPGRYEEHRTQQRSAWGRLIVREFASYPHDMRIGETPCHHNAYRLFVALIRMLGQAITVVEPTDVPRPWARRAKRRGLPSRVNVVRLRRINHTEPGVGHAPVEWSHRWFVKGHWRNQPYGPGRTLHRRIWVSPFIKGPDGAPLVVSEKVYALVR